MSFVSPGLDLNGDGIWTDMTFSGFFVFEGKPVDDVDDGAVDDVDDGEVP